MDLFGFGLVRKALARFAGIIDRWSDAAEAALPALRNDLEPAPLLTLDAPEAANGHNPKAKKARI